MEGESVDQEIHSDWIAVIDRKVIHTAWICILTSANVATAQMTPSPKPALAPAIGGLCAFAMAEGRVVETDCTIQTVYRGATYCFANVQDRSKFIKEADEYSVSAKSKYNELVNPQPTVPLPE